MLTPQEWRRIQEIAAIDDRTLAPLMLGRPVSPRTRKRVEAAARAARIKLPDGLFAAA